MLTPSQQQTLFSLLPSFKETWQQLSLLSQACEPASITVAACGLKHAGKSSLLNALSGHINKPYFNRPTIKPACAPTQLELPGMTLLDTPSLEAKGAAPQLALAKASQADLILLVHNARVGELAPLELDYVARISEQPEQPLAQHLLLVLTDSAELEDPDKASLLRRIHAQLQARFGVKLAHFWVDCATFNQGITAANPALIQTGGIADIQCYLTHNQPRLVQWQAEKVRCQQQHLKHQLAAQLKQAISQQAAKIKQQECALQQHFQRQELRAQQLQVALCGELQR